MTRPTRMADSRIDAARLDLRWSIVTVTFNSAAKLEEYWGGVAITSDVEWIVVDNGSSDHSLEVARMLGAKTIELGRNAGFGAANNVGFQHSSGDYVAFVNPDVTPKPADLTLLESYLITSPTTLVSPQLVNSDGSPQPNGRGLPFLANKVVNRLWPTQLEGTYLKLAGADETVNVDWLMGAVVAGTRTHLSALGPWDEHFFVYYEDSDLGLRNSRLGGGSVVIGSSTWTHGWARETKTASIRAWRREIPSMLKFYARYPHLLSLRPILSLPRRGT